MTFRDRKANGALHMYLILLRPRRRNTILAWKGAFEMTINSKNKHFPRNVICIIFFLTSPAVLFVINWKVWNWDVFVLPVPTTLLFFTRQLQAPDWGCKRTILMSSSFREKNLAREMNRAFLIINVEQSKRVQSGPRYGLWTRKIRSTGLLNTTRFLLRSYNG